ncbi:MAG: HD domain-containing protein [Candidatus Gastranaerophilales bacterium]|nr:HD domain-containing protein [Candidatus Gastranaerophilales bacterium]
MKLVSAEELINYKILPFNIYSEFGEKLFAAGEILTPGKLLQLRHINSLYRDEEIYQVDKKNPETEKPKIKGEVSKTTGMVVESFDMKPSTILKNKLSVDDIDIMNYKGPINKKAKIDPQTQLKIKAFYNQIISMMEEKSPLEMLGMFANVRDKIVQDILSESNAILFSSQLKLLGEYNKCHALNTAILSGAVAQKMSLTESTIYDVVLAGLLHDIGKCKVPTEILAKSNLTNKELAIFHNHTRIGYRIIKVEMELPDNIALVALSHHENNDGSGYPNGILGEVTNIETQIVNVCNYFDNLTSNRTHYKIKNTKEALRTMLEIGTQRFSAEALYTFIHMFSYNDTVNFEEMVL